MTITIKITSSLIREIRKDLSRPHAFAYERIGFITAACAWYNERDLMLICREYEAVSDQDYLNDKSAGAVIGSDAIRKGLQKAYSTKSALLHVHTHHGFGRPSFSTTDLESAAQFVPSFFNISPQVPHGILVLSDNSAKGLIWFDKFSPPYKTENFIEVGNQFKRI